MTRVDAAFDAAHTAKKHLAGGVVRCDHFADTISPDLVIALVWTYRRLRALGSAMRAYNALPTDDLHRGMNEAGRAADAAITAVEALG